MLDSLLQEKFIVDGECACARDELTVKSCPQFLQISDLFQTEKVTMDPEIASFVIKFQNLCRTGKSTNLSLSSKTGKVSVNLSVELGVVHVPPPPPPFGARRSRPSQIRRLKKRAEARKAFAEEASRELSIEEVDVIKLTNNAVEETDED